MNDTIRRRRILELFGTGTVVAVAGCLGEGDDGENGEAVDTADDSTDDTADDSTGSDGDDNGETTQSGDQTYADVHNYETSFAVDFDFDSPEPAVGTQVVHDGNYHVETETDEGMTIEMYGVDGDLYQVIMGECIIEERDPRQGEYVDSDQELSDQMANWPVSDTTTINGEEVYVFDETNETHYLSTATGYPVRIEWDTGTGDFHSWGETEPISAPDMDCGEAP